MRLLDVTRKDLLQSARSLTALIFMFAVPILVTVLFYFMFGGMGGGEEFTTPRSTVVVFDGDQGRLPAGFNLTPATGGNLDFDLSAAQSMGEVLTGLLQSDLFADLLQASPAASPEAARAAVDAQRAAVAVIIPADFTAALTATGGSAVVEIYRDPTLTLGPQIVASIVRQLVEGLAAGTIGTGVVLGQASQAGIPITPDLVQEVVARQTGSAFGQSETATLVAIQTPSGAESAPSFVAELLGLILGGMMTFFAFFSGAATIESLLVEQEGGTLQRLFTTPTPRRTILAGKALTVIVTLAVQITVLMIFGALVFDIRWGNPASAVLAGIGLMILAAATGVFLVSFLQSTRQSGVIFGGLLTLTGMLGMMPIFSGGATASPWVDAVALLVPQGWAIRGIIIARGGGAVADLAPTLLVSGLWAVVFLGIGMRRLQRRFA